MAITVGYIDALTHPAKMFRGDRADFLRMATSGHDGNGGIPGDPATATDFRVTPNSPADMTVRVAAGVAYVQGDEDSDQGYYRVVSDAQETLTVPTASGVNPRKDIVVLRVEDDIHDSSGQNRGIVQVIQGTAAPSPATPFTPNNCLRLAIIDVPTSATSIGASLGPTTGAITNDIQQIAPVRRGGFITADIRDNAITPAKLPNRTRFVTMPVGAWSLGANAGYISGGGFSSMSHAAHIAVNNGLNGFIGTAVPIPADYVTGTNLFLRMVLSSSGAGGQIALIQNSRVFTDTAVAGFAGTSAAVSYFPMNSTAQRPIITTSVRAHPTDGGSVNPGDMLRVNIQFARTDGGDTNTGTLFFYGAALVYTADS